MITGEIKSEMEFIALNVEEGDAFVLKNKGKVFMVDGGKLRGNKKGTSKNPIVIDKLATNNITNIDVLICTHYDSDHINGIIEIIESHPHKITELWLPDVFGDIALKISENNKKDLREIRNALHNDIKSKEKKAETSITNYVEKKPLGENPRDNSFEQFDVEFLEFIYKILKHAHYHLYDLECFKSYLSIKRIKKILKLIIKATKSRCDIRWFHYDPKCFNLPFKNTKQKYDIYALNSFETNIEILNPSQFINALLYLSEINKESLVFLYNTHDYPNVLFTADSNLGNTQLPLKDYSIITAPHHGSPDNKDVYSLIPDTKLVYVRSDYKNRYRPCSEYIKLPIKHCTICNNSTNPNANTVNLSYTKGNNWSPSTSTCTCK